MLLVSYANLPLFHQSLRRAEGHRMYEYSQASRSCEGKFSATDQSKHFVNHHGKREDPARGARR